MQVFYTRKYYIKSFDIMYMHKTTAWPAESVNQRRGASQNCPLETKWGVFAPECTGRTYFEGVWGGSTEPFVGAHPDAEGNPVYKYEQVDVGLGYQEGGYFQVFKSDAAECGRLQELKRQRWINKHTEYYRLDFVVYNPNNTGWGK